jgi:hypothetical protein
VRVFDLATMGLYPTDLLVEESPDVILGLLADGLLYLPRVEVGPVQMFGHRHHEHEVQPRARGRRDFYRGLGRGPRPPRPVDGEQEAAR